MALARITLVTLRCEGDADDTNDARPLFSAHYTEIKIKFANVCEKKAKINAATLYGITLYKFATRKERAILLKDFSWI